MSGGRVKLSQLPAVATVLDGSTIPIVQSGVTSKVTATNLGAYMADYVTTNIAPLTQAENLGDLSNVPGARANLGLGSIATQSASNVAITGGSITGITDLAIADGGTGASTATAATDNLQLADGESGAVNYSLGDYLRDIPIDAAAYGFVPSATDKSSQLQAAVDAALASGRELYIPPGSYRVDNAITAYLNNDLSYASSFRGGLRIRGAGPGRTIIDSRVSNGWLIYVTMGDGAGGEYGFASPKFGFGGYIRGMTIYNGAAATDSNAIRLRAQYQFALRDLHILNISGVGVKLRCSLGDTDGNIQTLIDNCRVENTGGWGLDLGADDGHNENSFTKLNRVFVQNCGTAEQKTITGITQANPGVVTCVGHGLSSGDRVFVAGVNGMTEANSSIHESSFTATVIDPNSFSIGVDTSGYGAYTSGGHVIPRTPGSGGVRVKGQITTFQSCGWTINKNRSVWIDGENTLGSEVFFYDSTIENPQIIGLHVQGNRGLIANGIQLYFNAAQAGAAEYWGHLYDGIANLVAEINISGTNIRSTNDAGEAHLVAFQSMGANVYKDTIRIDPLTMNVKRFGFTGQTMFKDITFDPVPQQCQLIVESSTAVTLRPDPSNPRGSLMPIRMTYGGSGGVPFSTGPWAPTRIDANGISVSNAGLAASTVYYAYLYALVSSINAPAIELSTTAPTIASDGSGYPVKTGDETRLAICDVQGIPYRIITDASGTPVFETTNSSWLAPASIGGDQLGTRGFAWVSSVDRKFRVKTNGLLPTSVADGTYEYWPTLESQAAGTDPVSLAAGATTTIEVAASCSSTDYCVGVAFAPGFQGLSAYGCVKTDNIVTVTLTNHTAGTIDLASSTIYVAVQRR